MKGFDLYRLAMGYLGVIIVLCAMVVFNPLRAIWSTVSAPVVQAGLVQEVPMIVDNLPRQAAVDVAPVAIPVPELAQSAPVGAVELMSLQVLAALRARAARTPRDAMALQALVSQALREGQMDTYMSALVNEAAVSGAVGATVGSVAGTGDGPVDRAVLLADIVSRSQGVELGEGDASAQEDGDLASDLAPDLAPEAALVAAGSDVTYTVGVGDSLGSLALRFYGDSALFDVIYQANRGLMAAPDQLRVGQVLIIPGRS